MTHIHSDHVGDVEAICAANPEALVVGIFEACNWLATKNIPNIQQNIRPMSKGGSQNIEGIEVIMTQAIHSSSFTEEDGTVVYGGEAGRVHSPHGRRLYCLRGGRYGFVRRYGAAEI